MTLRQVYNIKDNQLTIKLPDDFRHAKKVLVTIDEVADTRYEKMLQLQKAANDPLFLADVQEVSEDFKTIDQENV